MCEADPAPRDRGQETTGSVQVQVSRWGREQRGGGQWNAKLLSLSHSYQDDAPELSRLLVGHRISDITSKYKTSTSNPFLCAADFFLQLGSCKEAVR